MDGINCGDIACFCAAAVAFTALAGAAEPALARDRPGTPNFPSMVAKSPTQLELIWHDTTGDGDCALAGAAACDPDVHYEVDFTRDNLPYDPFHVAQGGTPPDYLSALSLDAQGYFRTTIDQVEPLHHYCFRVWSRYYYNNVRSQLPSAWACADTAAFPPGQPLGLTASARQGFSQAIVTWDVPDQSGYRPVDHFDIERQDIRGGGYPIVADGQIPGPNGDQDASTRLAFKYTSSSIGDPSKVQFRVCSVNNGGRTCTDFVPVQIWNPLYSAANGGIDQKYLRSPSANEVEQPAGSVPVLPTSPSSSVTRRNGDDTLRYPAPLPSPGGTAMSDRNVPEPPPPANNGWSNRSAQAVLNADSLNPQPLPPKENFNRLRALNPQPLPPNEDSNRLKALNPQPLPPKEDSNRLNALNPQPLPPKENFNRLKALNPQPLPPHERPRSVNALDRQSAQPVARSNNLKALNPQPLPPVEKPVRHQF